jgi:hypothetical protein
MAEIQQRADAAQLRSEDVRLSIEQRRQAAADSAALRRDLAEMKGGAGGGGEKWTPSGNVDDQGRPILYDKNDPSKTKVVGTGEAATGPGMGKAAYDKVQAANRANVAGVEQIDAALDAVEKNPGAFEGTQRYAGFAPEALESKLRESMTDDQQKARSSVFDITAEKIHARYGAALTTPERKQAVSYLPSQYDSPKQIRNKLAQLKSYMKVLDVRHGIGAPKPDAAPAAAPGSRTTKSGLTITEGK